MATRRAPAQPDAVAPEGDLALIMDALAQQYRQLASITGLLHQEMQLPDGNLVQRMELLDEVWKMTSEQSAKLSDALTGINDIADMAVEIRQLNVAIARKITAAETQSRRERNIFAGLLVLVMGVSGVTMVVRSRQMDRLEKRTRYLVHNQADNDGLRKDLARVTEVLGEIERKVDTADRHVLQHDARFEQFGNTFLGRVDSALESVTH